MTSTSHAATTRRARSFTRARWRTTSSSSGSVILSDVSIAASRHGSSERRGRYVRPLSKPEAHASNLQSRGLALTLPRPGRLLVCPGRWPSRTEPSRRVDGILRRSTPSPPKSPRTQRARACRTGRVRFFERVAVRSVDGDSPTRHTLRPCPRSSRCCPRRSCRTNSCGRSRRFHIGRYTSCWRMRRCCTAATCPASCPRRRARPPR